MRVLITSLLAIFYFTTQAQECDTVIFQIKESGADVEYNECFEVPLDHNRPRTLRFIKEIDRDVNVLFNDTCEVTLSQRENYYTVKKSGSTDCIISNAQEQVCTINIGKLRAIEFKFEGYSDRFDGIPKKPLMSNSLNLSPVSFVSRQTALMMQSPWKEGLKNTSLIQVNLLKRDIVRLKKLKVGAMIGFDVTHYNPYRDSVRFRPVFADYHPNAEQEFSSMLKERYLGAASESRDENKSNAPSGERPNNAPRGTDTSLAIAKASITSFYLEMTSLYESLYTKPTLNPDSLDIGILHIENSIAKHFGLTIVSLSAIEAKGNDWINNLEDGAERDKLRQQLKAGLDKYKKIKTYNHLTFLPEQIDNRDYTELTYNIKRGEQWGDDRKITIRNTWGSGFGYSVGLMGTGLRDYDYGLKRIATYRTQSGTMLTDTLFMDSIFQTDNGRFNIGPLVLGHFYTRIPGGVHIAISTGLGVNAQLDNHYFLGASLMIGRKNNLVFSGGMAWAKVNRLEARYQVGELLPVTNNTINSVSTRKIWDSGCVFSVSWQM